MIFIYFLLFFSFYYIYNYLKNRRTYELASKINGPKPLPIFGNALMYINIKPEDVIEFTQSSTKKYGKFFRVWVFNQLACFSSDPNDIEVVLSSQRHLTKNNLYDFLIPWLGTGLLISSGEKWFHRRRVITPTFHFKILEQFVEIFDRQSEVLVEQLKKHANGKSFNVYPFITLCALDIINESAMGTAINAQENHESEYVKAVSDISSILTARFIKIWQRNNVLFNLFASSSKAQAKAIRIMHKFTEDVIEKRRELLEDGRLANGNENTEEIDEFGIKRRFCFLDVLLKATINGQPLSNSDIREEVDTFMFEGHDTTTSAVSFMLFCLSKNKDVQDKLFCEIIKVIGNDPNAPTDYRQLQELKYMDLAVKEALRLYPPVPIIGRRFKEEININNKVVPANTNFSIGIFNMMRDPDYFENPLEYNPERFNTTITANTQNPYSFVPFSAGPRNCIGQKFALLEIKSQISKILRNYEVLPGGEEPQLLMNIVLKSKNGVHISLKPRLNEFE